MHYEYGCMSLDSFIKRQSKTSFDGTDGSVNKSLDRCLPISIEQNTDNDSTDSSSNETLQLQLHKKRKINTYKQKIKKDWIDQSIEKSEFWLTTNDKQETYCNVCNRTIVGGITHVKRHSKSQFHIKKIAALTTTPKLPFLSENLEQKTNEERIKSAEFKMIMFLAEHNLPFLVFDHLPKFIASVCPDSKIAKQIKCARKKGTLLCTEIIAKESVENISKILNSTWYSIIIDETTDVSIRKCLTVNVRYFNDMHNKVTDTFLGLIEVESATAEGLFDAIIQFLKQNEISLSNLVGFAADNASVMMGDKKGVQTRFREIVPDIYVLGCVCHSLHLCASAACKKLPDSVEQLAKDVVSYFRNSSKRYDELRECQVFAEIKPHKLLKPSQTRWLALQALIERIVEQMPALKLFFTKEANEEKHTNVAKNILSALNNPIFKLYFNFLNYVLPLINKMNLEFQSEAPQLHLLHTRMTTLYQTLLKNFIRRNYIDKATNLNLIRFEPRNYKDINEIYCGANCELLISNTTISPVDIKYFRVKCLDFYIELCTQIKNRFSFDDPVLVLLKNIDPAIASSGEVESIVPLAKLFPRLVLDLEELNTEWRLLSDTEEIKKNATKHLNEFWSFIFNMKNEFNQPMFPNLKYFIKGLLALPHSSATAERIFSQLNLIKTKTRNKLLIKTCNALLHAKELIRGKKCYEYEPSKSLLRRNLTLSIYTDTNTEELSF